MTTHRRDASLEPRILPLSGGHRAAGESRRSGADIPGSAGRTSPSPRSLLESLVAEASRARRDRGLPPFAIEIDVDASHVVDADPALLRRVFAALLTSAMDAVDHDTSRREVPRLREIVVTSIDHADSIEIEVADSGPGLAGRGQARLFDPDVAVDHSDHASRADSDGPSEARAIVERLGGSLHARDCPEGGAALTIHFPHRRAGRIAA